MCAGTVKKPLPQAEREIDFAVKGARISSMSISQAKRKGVKKDD